MLRFAHSVGRYFIYWFFLSKQEKRKLVRVIRLNCLCLSSKILWQKRKIYFQNDRQTNNIEKICEAGHLTIKVIWNQLWNCPGEVSNIFLCAPDRGRELTNYEPWTSSSLTVKTFETGSWLNYLKFELWTSSRWVQFYF